MEGSKVNEVGSVITPSPVPTYMAVQPGSPVEIGTLLVSDTNPNHRILGVSLLAAITRVLATFGQGPGQVNFPSGIAVDPNTRNIFVVDSSNHRVQKFSPNFVFIKAWGSFGSGDGQFNEPVGITFNRLNGTLLVSDFANRNIQVFTTDGVFSGKVQFDIIVHP